MRAALVPVGGDHLKPPAEFKAQLDDAITLANQFLAEKLKATSISLEQFFEKAKKALAADLNPLQLVQGELRDNACAFEYERAYMLAGVLSSRLYLKRENRFMEHALVKKTEPMRAMLAMAKIISYPHEELIHCWKLLLKNHPHDSICGCSIDEVHDEMQVRSKSLAGQLAVLNRQGQEALIKYLSPQLAEVRLGLKTLRNQRLLPSLTAAATQFPCRFPSGFALKAIRPYLTVCKWCVRKKLRKPFSNYPRCLNLKMSI